MTNLIGHPSYEAQRDNWIRWTKAEGMLKGYTCSLGRLQIPEEGDVVEPRPLPIYEQDAIKFEKYVLQLSKRRLCIYKLYHLDRYSDHGITRFTKHMGQKYRIAGVGQSTFYTELRAAEAEIKRRANFEQENYHAA